MSSRACYHFVEGDPGAEGDPCGSSALTDPGTVLQGLAMESDRDRSWWQGPSAAPDTARDEPGPGSFQGAQSGVKGGWARSGTGDKATGGSKMQPGMRPQQGLELAVTHSCRGDAARRLPRSIRDEPGGKHANRTAQARTESLEFNGAPGTDPRAREWVPGEAEQGH